MPTENCRRCGATYNEQPNVNLCEACQVVEDELFDRVYQYLRDNPGVNIRTLSEITAVDQRLILNWYRAGRLIGSGVGR